MDSNVNTLLIFLLLLLTALNSNEANAAFAPTAVQRVITTSTGATATTVFSRVAANQAIYDIRAVQVAKSSIATAARYRVLNPYGIALIAAVTAAGYFINDQGQIANQPEVIDDDVAENGYAYVVQSGTTYYGATRSEVCEKADWAGYGWSVSGNTCYRLYNGNPVESHPISYQQHTLADYSPYLGESTQINDDDLYEIASDLPYNDWQQLFEDPITGKPNPDITEFQDAANDAESDYQYANDGDPNTSPSVDPETGDTGTQNQTEQEPKDEDPCIKNPSLLMCSELDDVPEKTDIDTQDIDFDYEPYQLSGNSTCPANLQLPRGLELNYEPACDFATGISPVVILVFSIIGMYILGGYRMTD